MKQSVVALVVGLTISLSGMSQKTAPASMTLKKAIKGLPVPAKPAHQVLILGSPHFDLGSNASDVKPLEEVDMRTPKRQQEIEQLVQLLKKFNPTKICIEWLPKQDSFFKKKYDDYRAGKLKLPVGEYYQIGFRLAKELGHDRLYCIDNKPKQPESLLEVDDWDKYIAEQGSISAEERTLYDSLNARFNRYVDSVKALMTVKDILLFVNSDEVQQQRKRILFTGLVHAGNNTTYMGADLSGAWYQRNTRIFSNVKKIMTQPTERILVIYGFGHVFALDEIFRGSHEFNVVPVSRILQ